MKLTFELIKHTRRERYDVLVYCDGELTHITENYASDIKQTVEEALNFEIVNLNIWLRNRIIRTSKKLMKFTTLDEVKEAYPEEFLWDIYL